MFNNILHLLSLHFSFNSKQENTNERDEIIHQAKNGEIKMEGEVSSETKTTSIKVGSSGSITISGDSNITQRN